MKAMILYTSCYRFLTQSGQVLRTLVPEVGHTNYTIYCENAFILSDGYKL